MKKKRTLQRSKKDGFKHIKMKVGSNLKDDIRRARIIRDEVGPNIKIMMDANQKWDVHEAIENMKKSQS